MYTSKDTLKEILQDEAKSAELAKALKQVELGELDWSKESISTDYDFDVIFHRLKGHLDPNSVEPAFRQFFYLYKGDCYAVDQLTGALVFIELKSYPDENADVFKFASDEEKKNVSALIEKYTGIKDAADSKDLRFFFRLAFMERMNSLVDNDVVEMLELCFYNNTRMGNPRYITPITSLLNVRYRLLKPIPEEHISYHLHFLFINPENGEPAVLGLNDEKRRNERYVRYLSENGLLYISTYSIITDYCLREWSAPVFIEEPIARYFFLARPDISIMNPDFLLALHAVNDSYSRLLEEIRKPEITDPNISNYVKRLYQIPTESDVLRNRHVFYREAKDKIFHAGTFYFSSLLYAHKSVGEGRRVYLEGLHNEIDKVASLSKNPAKELWTSYHALIHEIDGCLTVTENESAKKLEERDVSLIKENLATVDQDVKKLEENYSSLNLTFLFVK